MALLYSLVNASAEKQIAKVSSLIQKFQPHIKIDHF